MPELSHYYPIQITLHAPMPLPHGISDAQSGLPGSVLRAAFAREVNAAPLAMGDESGAKHAADIERLVTSGKVRFLFAYPGVRDEVAGSDDLIRPLPLLASARWAEHATHSGRDGAEWPLFDALAAADAAALPNGEGPRFGEFAAYPAGSLVGGESSQRLPLAPSVVMDALPLSNTDDGRSSHALADGQTLVGMVQVTGADGAECSSLIRSVRDRLKAPYLSIGQWHRPGQDGVVSVSIGTQQTREASLLVFQNGHLAAGTVIRVLLTSPLVTDGESAIDALSAALSSALGEGALRLVSSEIRSAKSPTWAASGVAGSLDKANISADAGSVFVFEATRQLEDHQLLKLEHGGVGKGLADGFGRLVFMPAPVASLTALEPPHRGILPAPTSEPPATVLAAQERVLLRAVRRAMDGFARDFAKQLGPSSVPSAAVLTRLRGLLSGEPSRVILALREWVSGADNEQPLLRRDALDAMGTRAASGQSLRAWIQSRIDGTAKERLSGLARDIDLEDIARRHNIAGAKSASNTLKLPTTVDRLTVMLVDAVLEALAYRNPTANADEPGPGPIRGRPRRGMQRRRGRPGRGTGSGRQAKATSGSDA